MIHLYNKYNAAIRKEWRCSFMYQYETISKIYLEKQSIEICIQYICNIISYVIKRENSKNILFVYF